MNSVIKYIKIILCSLLTVAVISPATSAMSGQQVGNRWTDNNGVNHRGSSSSSSSSSRSYRSTTTYNSGPSPAEFERRRKTKLAKSATRQANKYFTNKQYDKAIFAYHNALKNVVSESSRVVCRNNLGVAYNDKGLTFFRKKDWANAISYYRKALNYNSNPEHRRTISRNLRNAEYELKRQQKQEEHKRQLSEAGKNISRILQREVSQFDNLQQPNRIASENSTKALAFVQLDQPLEAKKKEIKKESPFAFLSLDESLDAKKEKGLISKSVPLPKLPVGNKMADYFQHTNNPSRLQPLITLTDNLKSKAGEEIAHTLKTTGIEALYTATAGKFKLLSVGKNLLSDYQSMNKSYNSMAEKLFQHASDGQQRVITLGVSGLTTDGTDSDYDQDKVAARTTDSIKDLLKQVIGKGGDWTESSKPFEPPELDATVMPISGQQSAARKRSNNLQKLMYKFISQK